MTTSSNDGAEAAPYPASLITVATCTLNQWALDFDGNLERTLRSCIVAREAGATYRLGPELELSGYGCEDHFYEMDTIHHCWESLALLLERGGSDDILIDVGMPIVHQSVRYNCRVLCYNREILCIRPKLANADGGNYRESRYFTAYSNDAANQTLWLPPIFATKFGQRTAPFGTSYLKCGNTPVSIGCESCEELWTPAATHIGLSLRGVEIIGNASGSHHELRKLNQRLELMISATRKCGGVYLYSNQRGCDGGRSYYDGGAIIVCNGNVLAQAKQFDVDDVEVIVATVDLDEVRSYRASIPSFGIQADKAQDGGCIACANVHLVRDARPNQLVTAEGGALPPSCTALGLPTSPIQLHIHKPEEECCLGPACWLWDYLRRSGASGFLLPLSGGADSSSVATIVGAMCQMAYQHANENPAGPVAADVRRICAQPSDWLPASSQEIASHVFHTVFLGTEHSSQATTGRAQRLAETIGAYHLCVPIDTMCDAMVQVFRLATGKLPKFQLHGGTMTQDLALQNIQARIRMVTAYLFAQLLPWVRGNQGFLLVLGSANVDEGLRGYLTKYDCSSADLNPIGAISKGDLKRMLLWASHHFEWPVLAEIAGAPPTAELRPQVEETSSPEHSQLDEEEMGMTYAELGLYGGLRKLQRCGPVSMFRKLLGVWSHLSAAQVAVKVKRFFVYYSINRHKMCTLTPAYHAEGYSPDDNRFDLRQFLYNTKWPRQFAVIDKLVERRG